MLCLDWLLHWYICHFLIFQVSFKILYYVFRCKPDWLDVIYRYSKHICRNCPSGTAINYLISVINILCCCSDISNVMCLNFKVLFCLLITLYSSGRLDYCISDQLAQIWRKQSWFIVMLDISEDRFKTNTRVSTKWKMFFFTLLFCLQHKVYWPVIYGWYSL